MADEYVVKDLDRLLGEKLGLKVEILQQNSEYLTAPGDNYGSIILAQKLKVRKSNGKLDEFDLVTKFLPASEVLRITFHIDVTFKKEVDMYTKAIPALVEFQQRSKIDRSKTLDIFAECYGGRVSLTKDVVDDDATLILENLKLQGYQMGDRLVGLSYEEADVAVRDLAKFHAITIAYRLLRPEEFQKNIGPCFVYSRGVDALPETIENVCIASIHSHAKNNLSLRPYLKTIEKNIRQRIQDMRDKIPWTSAFATLAHSDFWLNNVMFKKDSAGKPIKSKIIDLQIMQYDTCVTDLIFFLVTSVISNEFDKHYDELIKAYHQTFVDHLKDYKVDMAPYSWDNFLAEIPIAAKREITHIFFMLKPMFTERGSVEKMEDFELKDVEADTVGKAFVDKLEHTILTYVEKNWL